MLKMDETERKGKKMEGNTFYELRERLYATAAAGCSLIEEDFRLKRALEAFQPMSEANKVFGRLYQMCEKLFHSDNENVAGHLADCIALADAMAVAQGSFLDSSECKEKEKEIGLKPQTISNRYITEIKNRLLEERIVHQSDVPGDIQLLLEPRLFLGFIQSLKRDNKVLDNMARDLLPQLGDALIPIIKEQIDFETTGAKNKTAYYIKLIARLYGEKETNWYIEVAENKEYPQSIRSAAVWALGQSEKNGSKLLELYKTQKGSVKDAIIYELARLDPPEAEPVWKNLTEKYKEKYTDFIALSKSDICAEFVRKIFHETMERFEQDYKEGKKKAIWSYGKENEGLNWIRKTIRRKYQLEDCFLLFVEKYEYVEKMAAEPYSYSFSDWREEMNQALIENLIEEDNRYSEMIKHLYNKHKEFYFPARFFLALKETGEQAVVDYFDEMHRQRDLILRMLANIEYDSKKNGYCISWDCITQLYGIGKEQNFKLKIFDTFPNELISFASETDYFIEETDTVDNSETTFAINRSLEILSPQSTMQDKKTADYEKCKEAVIKFAFDVNRRYSTGYEIDKLREFFKGESKEYMGLVSNYVLQNIFRQHERNIMYRVDYEIGKIENLPMNDEDRKTELLELKKKVEALEVTSFEASLQERYKKKKEETICAIKNIILKHGWDV